MSTRHRFAGKKLPLTLAFGVLVAAAIGAACNGFFQDNTLVSLAIQPPSPQVQVGQSTGLQAWGTYQDNSRSLLTSGVAWTSSGQDSTVDISPSGEITGVGTGGTATITASSQGISSTATATSFLGNVSGLTICTGTFNTGACPASTWIVSAASSSSQTYYAKATSSGTTLDVTAVATWTVTPTATAGSVTCSNSGVPPETCTVTPTVTPTGTYVITVTYPGTTPVTANITVNPT